MAVSQVSVARICTYDNVRAVDYLIEEAESGYFGNAALLVDQILRDARIFAVMMTRVLGLLGKDLEFDPPKETAHAKKLAEDIEADWPSIFSDAALVDLLTWGLMLGVGLGQVIKDGPAWTLEVWHPWALEWDTDKRAYFVETRTDTGGRARLEIIPDGKGAYTDAQGTHWVLFTPYGYGNAGRRGLLRNLHRLYLERQWAHRDRSRYSEVHGQPMRFGIAPLNSEKADRVAFKNSLSFMGAEPVVVAAHGEEGNRWDVKLVEAQGKSTELFQVELEQLDKEIATLVLGQSQSTDGQGGLGTQENAGESVRLDVMRFDGDNLSSTLRAQVLVPYCAFTYGGNGEQAPWPCWDIDPPEDTKSRAEEFKALMDGIAVAKAQGIPVDERALLEAFNVPMLSEADAAKLLAEAEAKKAAELEAVAAARPDAMPAPNGKANGAKAAAPAQG